MELQVITHNTEPIIEVVIKPDIAVRIVVAAILCNVFGRL